VKVNQPTTCKNIKSDTVSPLPGLPCSVKNDTVSLFKQPAAKAKSDTVSLLKQPPAQTKSDTVSLLKTSISSLRRDGISPKKSVRSASSSRPPFVVMPDLTATPDGSFCREVRCA
jgi:hypothetical protein